MSRYDGKRVVMVFNGEIYNYRHLRDQLVNAGLAFSTSSDAEVLLAGFQLWGTEVFSRARGMWAAAFWEPEPQRLTLVRDPLGKKPLVYSLTNGRMVFGSSATTVLALTERTPDVDRSALACYLGHIVVPYEHSMFVGMRKVPPASYLTWVPGGEAKVTRFWSAPSPEAGTSSTKKVDEEIEQLLRAAVRRRLESDVPLGVFLSAGFDSGIIAALAAQESGRSLVAVTAGTTGSPDDERQVAALVAQRFGLQHRPLEMQAVSAHGLPFLIAELGEPMGDSSILPSFEVARAARREITVSLTGDGGDEAFFGYSAFQGAHYASYYRRAVPKVIRSALRGATQGASAWEWVRRLGALFEYGAAPLPQSFRNRMGFGPEDRARLLRVPDGAIGHDAEHIYAERLIRWANLPDADALRRTWYETVLPNAYLAKVDTATMAASLEARSPFLDLDLVQYLLRLPQRVLFPNARPKHLLRPLALRLLPREVTSRRKTGFSVPISDWLRGSLVPAMEEFVFRKGTLMAELVDPVTARTFLVAHQRGAEHGTRLWALLVLGVWCAVTVERRWSPQEPLPMHGPAGVENVA